MVSDHISQSLTQPNPWCPSPYNIDTTFLLLYHINGQNAFTKCVLYFLNLPIDKSYLTGVGSLSDLLDIASNSILKTSCIISGTSVADTWKGDRHLKNALFSRHKTCETGLK